MGRDYYASLGISKDATADEIQRAYTHMALPHHPKALRRPRIPHEPFACKAEEGMKQTSEELSRLTTFLAVGEAFDVLNDPKKRAIYDRFGEQALKEGIVGPEGFIPPYAYHGDPEQTFTDYFGTNNPYEVILVNSCDPNKAQHDNMDALGFREKGSTRPLPISLEEAYNGSIRKVMIPRKHKCADGISVEMRDHVMTVVIPKGAFDGMEFNFPNEGDGGPNDMPTDIIFKLNIQSHPPFHVEGNNLILTTTVTLYEALTEKFVIPVNMPDGRSFRLYNVHNVVEPGYEQVIKGEGMPILGEEKSGKKGDLILRFDVIFPTSLTSAQKMHLKKAIDIH